MGSTSLGRSFLFFSKQKGLVSSGLDHIIIKFYLFIFKILFDFGIMAIYILCDMIHLRAQLIILVWI